MKTQKVPLPKEATLVQKKIFWKKFDMKDKRNKRLLVAFITLSTTIFYFSVFTFHQQLIRIESTLKSMQQSWKLPAT